MIISVNVLTTLERTIMDLYHCSGSTHWILTGKTIALEVCYLSTNDHSSGVIYSWPSDQRMTPGVIILDEHVSLPPYPW